MGRKHVLIVNMCENRRVQCKHSLSFVSNYKDSVQLSTGQSDFQHPQTWNEQTFIIIGKTPVK